MIYFNAEYVKDYGNYSFGYARYLLREEGDDPDHILKGGFLPYTGDPTLVYPLYYMARSLRIDLNQYSESSENRRVNRKFTDNGFSFQWLKKEDAGDLYPTMESMALEFSSRRFSTGQMPGDRFSYIYHSPAATHICLCKKDNELAAYILTGLGDQSLHYWFSFYDLEKGEQGPFGKWIMWKVLEWARSEGLRYVYLGTCYGKSALYKARDFKGAEYFDGTMWSADIQALKDLCKKDKPYDGIDAFKARKDRNDYLERLLTKRIEIE